MHLPLFSTIFPKDMTLAIILVVLAIFALFLRIISLRETKDILEGKRHVDWFYFRQNLIAIPATIAIGIAAFYLWFPGLRPKDLFLSGIAIGFLPGLLIGTILCTITRKSDSKWTYTNFILFTMFVILGILMIQRVISDKIPKFQKQREHLISVRLLGTDNANEIRITFENDTNYNITSEDKIKTFQAFLAKAKLCPLKYEKHFKNVKINLHTNQWYTYTAYIPSESKDDIILEPLPHDITYAIQLPDLNRWLDQSVFNKNE